MSVKARLAKLEETLVARANQQMKYAGDDPMQRYMTMLNDTAYRQKIRKAPQHAGINPRESYLAMTGEKRHER